MKVSVAETLGLTISERIQIAAMNRYPDERAHRVHAG